MLTPIVAIVTLAATIITQTYQTIRSEREKSDAALEAQWQDTLKAFAVITKLPAGIVELRPFLDSPKYGDRAREAVVEVLASSSNGELFTQLFGAFVPVRWNNLGYVLKIDRAIKPKAIATLNKANRTKDEQALADYYLAVIPEISEQVGSLLKTSRVAAQSVDLSDGYFFGSDWQGVDLSGADIENVRLDNLSLKGANLQITSHFGGASFFHVAWWQAQEISPVLRAYLQERYKCDPTQGYGPDEQERFTADQCSAAGAVVQPPQ